MKKIKEISAIDYTATKRAFSYQNDAFEAIKDLEYSAIFHEQGLGKTKIAIDLSLYWLSRKSIDSVFIVTKKQLIKNWQDEFKIHTHLKPSLLGTNRGENYYTLNGISKIILTNFETVEFEFERIKMLLKLRNVAIILDESTKIKNPKSKLTQCFIELSEFFKIKVIMTGTPVANRPYDIWSQIYFLDHGKSLGNDFISFKKENDLTNKMNKDEDARRRFEKNVGSIFTKIDSFCVRETKKSCGISLPEKEFISVYASFESEQYKFYFDVIKNFKVEIKKDGDIILDNDDECLKRLLRLNQIVSNPKLINDFYSSCSGKEIELEKLIKQIIRRNEKCIIWTSYVENVNYFCSKYSKYGAVKIHGSMNIQDRNMSIDSFKNDRNIRLLFATPQAAKEGLTLTVANNAIFYDRTFNLDDYLQAQDRIHRISQTKKCMIYIIMIKGSIDEWIDALINAKQNAAWLAQGDISKQEYRIEADYSYADIIKQILKETN